MDKTQELNLFLEKSDELISSKVILADVKMVGLLKAIASSQTIVAILESCLADFNYAEAKRECFVKNKLSNRGEYIIPSSTKTMLALVFNVLMELDNKTLNLNEFLTQYFYVNGSYFESYNLFINQIIKPFKASIKQLMEGVIGGWLQDPLEELKTIKALEEENKSYPEVVQILEKARENALKSKLDERELADLTAVIDMLISSVKSGDKEAIDFTMIAYKYASKVYKKIKLFAKEIESLLND